MTIEFIALSAAVVAAVVAHGVTRLVRRRASTPEAGIRAASNVQGWVMVAVAAFVLVLALIDDQHRLLHTGLGLAMFAIGISALRRNRARRSPATPTV